MLALILTCVPALAQDPFAGGWVLQPDSSTLGFQSVKNDTKVEQNSFATVSGEISDQGLATLRVELDSIDTKIDLRNVRMRFLFFETFKFPQATITARIDPALLADLPTKRHITLTLPYTLDLHGVKRDLTADVSVTLISDDLVAISSVGTIPIAAADFDLEGGVTKLQEAAKVKIVPSGSITFNWLFARTDSATAATQTPATQTPATQTPATETPAAAPAEITPAIPIPEAPKTAALEPIGNFDPEACLGRFEILSNAGNINFRSGSATLNVAGSAILANLVDIISRCPGMKVELGGHTDDLGSDAANLSLSEKRANAVRTWLIGKGIAADRLTARGYGENLPLVTNDTAANMARNRRIEFKVLP
jgi:outer membrane protein OmpA-like peptidoglycan-associated protein/polyisoprenoid-binding protein YceI